MQNIQEKKESLLVLSISSEIIDVQKRWLHIATEKPTSEQLGSQRVNKTVLIFYDLTKAGFFQLNLSQIIKIG